MATGAEDPCVPAGLAVGGGVGGEAWPPDAVLAGLCAGGAETSVGAPTFTSFCDAGLLAVGSRGTAGALSGTVADVSVVGAAARGGGAVYTGAVAVCGGAVAADDAASPGAGLAAIRGSPIGEATVLAARRCRRVWRRCCAAKRTRGTGATPGVAGGEAGGSWAGSRAGASGGRSPIVSALRSGTCRARELRTGSVGCRRRWSWRRRVSVSLLRLPLGATVAESVEVVGRRGDLERVRRRVRVGLAPRLAEVLEDALSVGGLVLRALP